MWSSRLPKGLSHFTWKPAQTKRERSYTRTTLSSLLQVTWNHEHGVTAEAFQLCNALVGSDKLSLSAIKASTAIIKGTRLVMNDAHQNHNTETEEEEPSAFPATLRSEPKSRNIEMKLRGDLPCSIFQLVKSESKGHWALQNFVTIDTRAKSLLLVLVFVRPCLKMSIASNGLVSLNILLKNYTPSVFF